MIPEELPRSRAPAPYERAPNDEVHLPETRQVGQGQENRRQLWRVFALTAVYLVVEVVGGKLLLFRA